MRAVSDATIRVGTRGSALALAQARLVAATLAARGARAEIVVIETEGDRRAPDTAWGEGAFVKSIEHALLEGRADVAVHSAKDVPTEEDPRLVICAYLPREDPRDALVAGVSVGGSSTLAQLPAGSVIGTDSPRRSGFIRSIRPDLEVRPLHGNVDTRLRRLDAGEVDALVLAVAGLARLGLADRIDQRIPADQLPPAPGQGAIAVQVRATDRQLISLGERLDDPATRSAVEAERAFLRRSGGGCRAPIGALAQVADGRLSLLGGYAAPDGRMAVVDTLEGQIEAGSELAGELADRLERARGRLAVGPRLLLTRPLEQSRRLATHLARLGLNGVVVPAIEIVPAEPTGPFGAALARLGQYEWVVVTSANGAQSIATAAARLRLDLSGVQWAAVGQSTARSLRVAGALEVWFPRTASSEGLGEELPLAGGERVLLARGNLADGTLPGMLQRRGAQVEEVVAYRTVEGPSGSRRLLLDALSEAPLEAVIFTSPSAVRGSLALAGGEGRAALLGLPAICIGSTTEAAAREAGFSILGRTTTQDAVVLAELAAGLLLRRNAGMPA